MGLFTAIQMKILKPDMEIHFFEKYAKYQRNHTVLVNSAKSFENSIVDRGFKRKMLKHFNGAVRTSELETKLKRYAAALNITVENQAIQHVDEIKTRFPHTQYIIGSDGSHSVIRQTIFVNQPPSIELQHLAEIKYEVNGDTRNLSSLEFLRNLRKVNHLITAQRVGKRSACASEMGDCDPATFEAKTPVAFGVVINKSEFDELKEKTSFKAPILLNSVNAHKSVPPKLYNTIHTWLAYRKKFTGEKIVRDSIKLTVLPLVKYFTPAPYLLKDGIHYFLVGDSAFGVPYFRNVNNGFESGNVLAKIIAHTLNHLNDRSSRVNDPRFMSCLTGVCTMRQEQFEDYNFFMKALQKRENVTANAKDLALRAIRSSTGFAQALYRVRVFLTRLFLGEAFLPTPEFKLEPA